MLSRFKEWLAEKPPTVLPNVIVVVATPSFNPRFKTGDLPDAIWKEAFDAIEKRYNEDYRARSFTYNPNTKEVIVEFHEQERTREDL